MKHRIHASISDPVRNEATWSDRWAGSDRGLITAWEVGRERAVRDPDLARRALQGELMELPWKGGIVEPLKSGWKFGALHYLAMWKGLRGEDLDLVMDEQIEVICSRTQMRVVFTGDIETLLRG
jgi:hypothetical protein